MKQASLNEHADSFVCGFKVMRVANGGGLKWSVRG